MRDNPRHLMIDPDQVKRLIHNTLGRHSSAPPTTACSPPTTRRHVLVSDDLVSDQQRVGMASLGVVTHAEEQFHAPCPGG